jgi:hypothetical protein
LDGAITHSSKERAVLVRDDGHFVFHLSIPFVIIWAEP